ncbi:MAG: hypothetical protein ACRELD_00625 [Longimicrobiales bacterium]
MLTGALAAVLLSLGGLLAQEAPAAPGEPPAPAALILASEVELSRNAAELRLELADGRELAFALDNGRIEIDGETVGEYDRSGELNRSWRALLSSAIETPNDDLSELLVAWQAPSGNAAGERLDEALEAAVLRSEIPAAQDGAAPEVTDEVVVERLQSRIEELESMLDDLESRPHDVRVSQAERGFDWARPFRHIGHGLGGLISTLVLYGVLVGLGFAVVFFGRRYLEAVADTARHHTLRSWAVGLAGSFLAIPVFVLGIIALAVSIIGIPLLLAWVPLFPMAFGLATILGYLAVAHATGEALAERRLQGADWFSRGNSYYYLMTGLGVLLALYAASHVIEMAGPWLDFLQGTLLFFSIMITWAALTIGLGAVLLSRAGTRPITPRSVSSAEDIPLYEGEKSV